MRSILGAPLVIAVMLAACGKNEASGVYVLANDNEVALVQIVEDKDHKVTGRIQTSTIGPDGVVAEKSSTFDGSVSGNDLVLRPSSVWLGGMEASGTYDSDGINLTGRGFTFTAKRASLSKYQDAVAHLREVAAERKGKVDTARAEVQQQAAVEQEGNNATRVQEAVTKIAAITTRLTRGVDRVPDFGKAAAANTARIERMVQASASMSEFQRGTLGIQANQVIVGTNQIEVQCNQLQISADGLVSEARAAADAAGRLCGANPTGQLAQPCNAARDAVQNARAAKERINGILSGHESRIKAEIEKQETLAAKIDG